MRVRLYVLAATLMAAMPSVAQAQGKPAPLTDILLAACVQGAKYSSDNPRQVEYVSGKAQPTSHGIVNNPKFTDIISVVATMKVGGHPSQRTVRFRSCLAEGADRFPGGAVGRPHLCRRTESSVPSAHARTR